MGEIITKPIPEQPLEFNGERLTSSFGGQTAIEHWHRYLLARELVRGRDVLDVACGEGYGSALLSQTARSVVGVDISATAIQHAQSSYPSENLKYLEGDALCIPVANASVDAVVSFETLEHFVQHDRFLAEIKRVLRPDGFLLISTPDRDNYTAAATPPNPYHKLELTTAEFVATLRQHFALVSHQGQRVLLGSALIGWDGSSRPPLSFERRGATHFEASVGMARARYIVALASDSPEPILPDSVFIDTDQLLQVDGPALEQLHADMPSLATARAQVADVEAAFHAGQTNLIAARQEVADLRSAWETSLAQLGQAQQDNTELKAALELKTAQLAAAQHENAQLKPALDAATAQLSAAQQETGQLRSALDMTATHLKATRERVTRLESDYQVHAAQLAAAEEENQQSKSAQATAEQQNAAWQSRWEASASQLATARQALEAAAHENEALRSRVQQDDEKLEMLSRDRARLEQQLAAVYRSTSWRLSAPVRVTARLFGRG